MFNSNDVVLYFTTGFSKTIISDQFAFFTKFLVCFFSFLYFFIIADFLKEYRLSSFEYLLIMLFAIFGLVLLCISNDLLSAYLSIELISLSSYVLAGFKKTSSYSAEAGVKYLITGAISSAFFLLGSSFIYAYCGSVNLIDLGFVLSDSFWFELENTHSLLEPFLEIGVSFVFLSLLIKLAVAPFHIWSLEVYEGSPIISTFFLLLLQS